MYAIFTMRKLQLTQRINNLQFSLMQISQKLQDLSVYAGNVADGIISPSEFLNSPASIFGVNMNFFNNSVPKALFEASRASQAYNMNLLNMNSASGGHYGMAVDASNPQAIFANQFFVFSSFFKQALDAAGKAEAANIKRIESDIQAQKLMIETQLKAAETELKAVEDQEMKNIEKTAPKYA